MSPDSSHKTGNRLFIDYCQGWKEGSFVWLFDIFRGWLLIRLTWNLSRFVQNSVEIPWWNFWKKLFRDNFFRGLILIRLSWNLSCFVLNSVEILTWICRKKQFHANQGYPLPKLVKFRLTFCNFNSASVLCWKNS